MRTIVLLTIILLIGSCCNWIPKRCITGQPPDTILTVRIDTFKIIKDTIIEVEILIPGDTVRVPKPYPVYLTPDGLINSDTLFLELELARAWSVVVDSELMAELIQKDTLFKMEILLENAIRETKILRDSLMIVTQEKYVIKHKRTKITWILGAIIFILLIILCSKIIAFLIARK